MSPYGVEGHRHRAELEQELGDGCRITFTPHLLPIDQGLLASCYVTASRQLSAEEVRDLFRAAYDGEPFVELADAPPGVRDVRDTNICRIHATVEPATGTRARVRGHRQPLEGRGRPGGAGPEPDAGAARGGGGPAMTFFRSRWVDGPEHVTELDPAALPAGFRAAGVHAGLKADGLDVGLVVSDRPETTSAARFTTNARVGAPVAVSRDAALDRLRAVVANSGGSNTGDGERGLETARASQLLAAELLGVEPEQVGLASTGVIGAELPREPLLEGVRDAQAGSLGGDADGLSEAILTTDRGPKRACLEVALPPGPVRLAAQAKGAGMISPRFATMFCFVETDAALAAETVDLLTGVCVKRSFDRISVDGQLSTSDTVFVLASGASGVRVEPESADELALGEALDALLRQLALEIVADGEGAARVGRVVVRGGRPPWSPSAARSPTRRS